jgi:nucleoside-diphosphate-sugar epimerase
MIYLSSISVHGIVSAPVIDEVLPIVDPDIYGTTKYLGERMLASTATNMPVVSIRLPGVLGRGATCRVWIPMLLKKMINNEDVELYNPDEKFNNAIHVSDLANFILKLLRRDTLSGFHAFPIAASGMTTIREVAEYLKKLVNSSSIIIVKSSERQAFTINSRYAVSHFGYEQRAIIETIDNFVKDALISQ